MTDLDKTIENIEQGNAWEESDEIVQVETKQPLDKVVPVRLRAVDWEKLRTEARELGVGPTTLARMWILERLRRRSILYEEIFTSLTRLVQNEFPDSLLSTLTLRQWEIFSYLNQGYSNKQIAEKMGLNVEDIDNYLEEFRKLSAGNESFTYKESKNKV